MGLEHAYMFLRPLYTQAKSYDLKNLRALENHPKGHPVGNKIPNCNSWVLKLMKVKVDHDDELQHILWTLQNCR